MTNVLARDRKGGSRGNRRKSHVKSMQGDWSDLSTSQGTPRIAGSHQRLQERQEWIFHKSLEREPTLPIV